MTQTDALTTHVDTSGPFVRVTLTAPAIASGLAPGRFILADLGGYLRTPLFPVPVDAERFEVLISPDHPAAALRSGTKANVMGPLGRGFEVPRSARRLLLAADTAHLPVLLPLLGQKPGFSIALLLSALSVGDLYPIRLLPPALEVHVVTTDGSAGHKGSVLEPFADLARWADCICVADDPTGYPALAEIVREVRVGPGPRSAQALVVPPMVCGVGACQGCAVAVANGVKLACTDGPVFDLLELR
jgi:dihydroorotate dehydrogenase electron transfer subunit